MEEVKELPKSWNQYPYSAETTGIFSSKAINRDFFALKVPSTIVGLEYNFVLNPLYKDFGKVAVAEFIPLPLDERLKH